MKHRITSIITVVALADAIYFLRESVWLWPSVAFILIAYFLIIAFGAFNIQANYFMNSINQGDANGITFTFDDGPDPNATIKILDLLSAENIKATFFVIGKKAEKFPEVVKLIHEQGHTVANHSYSHTNALTFSSTKKLTEDFKKCSDIIEKIIHVRPKLFRPPFGVTNPKYDRALQRLDMQSIGWSGRSLDTVIRDKNKLLVRVIKHIKPGGILLFHDTESVTLETLPEIIAQCRKNGIKIVSLQEQIHVEPYQK